MGVFRGLRGEVGLDLDGFSTPPITSFFEIASVLRGFLHSFLHRLLHAFCNN